MNGARGFSLSRKGNLPLVTSYRQGCSRAESARNAKYALQQSRISPPALTAPAVQQGQERAVRSRISYPEWRARPPTIVCSKLAHTNIYDEFVRGTLPDPYVRIAVTGCTEQGGHSAPRVQNLILDTSYPQGGSRPGGSKNRRHSVRRQISSPGWRACPRTTASSKLAHTYIYDKFCASGQRFFV